MRLVNTLIRVVRFHVTIPGTSGVHLSELKPLQGLHELSDSIYDKSKALS